MIREFSIKLELQGKGSLEVGLGSRTREDVSTVQMFWYPTSFDLTGQTVDCGKLISRTAFF